MIFVFMFDLIFYCYFINTICVRLISIQFKYVSLCFVLFLFLLRIYLNRTDISESEQYMVT